MKIKNILTATAGILLASSLMVPLAFADTVSATTANTTTTPAMKAMGKAKERANQEIVRRVTALSDLSTRINNMMHISDADKASLTGQLKSQADVLTTLNTKIQADDSTTTLKDDVKSITDAYRIFALVIPQGRIYASVDRIHSIFIDMTVLGTKLQARITEAEKAGKNVVAATSALADYNAKLADASVQAQAAETGVSGLIPDMGDKTKMQANTVALKDARTKLKVAVADIAAARKDVDTIRKNLPKVTSTATSTPVTSTTTSTQ